jgi:adenine-specific DNA-methyltransferase
MSVTTAAGLAEMAGISRSYLYYLKAHGIINVGTSASGRAVWDTGIAAQIKRYKKASRKSGKREPAGCKTCRINNRRYLGNKYKLLPFIKKVAARECGTVNTVADIFSGTGSAASVFAGKKVILNDILYSNYICNFAWFGALPFSREKVTELIIYYNKADASGSNYMTENFSGTYFSRENCAKIGFIREDIERRFKSGVINGRERALLITSLIYAMDKIANTCGHYDAYRKNAPLCKKLVLRVPVPPEPSNPGNLCLNMDANELVRHIEADLVYIDPPYNSRQYCDTYHLLENVARWQKPEVSGVARKMDRSGLKSDYCTEKAPKAFADLIKNIRAKYIIMSYNNMAEKGNGRSNAKISDTDILRALKAKGEVKVFSRDYKAFTAGKSDIRKNAERLFFCRCRDAEKEIIQSPLNYTGGKFKLLPQLLPLFPKDAELFVDLFCGGCNVGVNAPCSRVVFNDKNPELAGLFNTFLKLPKSDVFTAVGGIIKKYGLSDSSVNGYAFYGCKSPDGLGKYNREPFLKLRGDFNSLRGRGARYYLMLYVLIIYSFNNQIRFNSAGMFNLPVGKRDFNKKMRSKLSRFIDRIKSEDVVFENKDFRLFDTGKLTRGSFVYADPPYLITCATYNERGGWTENDEKDLLAMLDAIDARGCRFALSNVLSSKGKTNEILLSWINSNRGRYRTVHLKNSYSNSNYHTRDKKSPADEVAVLNYTPGSEIRGK